jgi:lipopolysaccharide biosynthesis glycosyltransferase
MVFRRNAASQIALAEPISVVSASDDNYAMPLAVTIRSLIDHLSPGQSLAVSILDGGLTDHSKARLVRSWKTPQVTVQFLRPPVEQISDLKIENHLNLVTYLRLFMPSLLPQAQERTIFLDADLLIRRNIAELWTTELGDAPIAAVNDYFTPYLNTREALGRPSICDQHPDKCHPVPNYRELGLAASAGYFNAGVMVVNLKKWREMDVLHRAVDLVRRHQEHVRYCDQYALNVLFSGHWKQLDFRWNQNSNLAAWCGPEVTAFDDQLFYQLRDEPWIVHYTWLVKPWHTGCTHPFTPHFFRTVDRTDWRGWRPPAPPREPIELSQVPTHVYQSFRRWRQKQFSPVIRALKHKILGRNKAA